MESYWLFTPVPLPHYMVFVKVLTYMYTLTITAHNSKVVMPAYAWFLYGRSYVYTRLRKPTLETFILRKVDIYTLIILRTSPTICYAWGS